MHELLFFGIVIGTLILTAVVGLIKNQGMTAAVYESDQNQYGILSLIATVLGTIIGGGMYLAVGQVGYEGGLAAYVLATAAAIGLGVAAILAPRMRQSMKANEVRTLIDLLQKVYSSRVAMLFCGVSLLLFIAMLAGQIVAICQFTQFALPKFNKPWVLYVPAVFAILMMFIYPIIGGLRKDIATDCVQVVIIAVAMAIIGYFLVKGSTLPSLLTKLPASHFNGAGDPGKGYGWTFITGVALFVPSLYLVRMDMWQRIGAARDDKTATTAFAVSAIGTLLAYVLFATVGMVGRVAGFSSSKTVVLEWLFGSGLSSASLAVVIGGLYAAVLSSADTFMNNASIFAGRLYHRCRNLRPDEEGKLLWVERVAGVLMFALAIVLAICVPDLVELFAAAMGLLLVFVCTILGTFMRSLRSERAAFWSGLLGTAIFVILWAVGMTKTAFPPAVLVAIVTHVFVARRDGSTRPALAATQ